MAEVKNPREASRRILLLVLWLTVMTFVVKIAVGGSMRSLAVLAESTHTLIDGFSTILSLLALSSPDREQGRPTWGHGLWESGLMLTLVGLLGFISISLLALALQQWEIGPTLPWGKLPSVELSWPLLSIIGSLFILSLGITLWQLKVAQRWRRLQLIRSSMILQLTARQVLQDSWLVVLTIGGLLAVDQGYGRLDAGMAIVLVITAIISCWRVLNWQVPFLVRQGVIAPEGIRQLSRSVPGVSRCFAIRSRGLIGRQVLLEMRLGIHPDWLAMSQMIQAEVTDLIRQRYGVSVQVVIQLDWSEADPEHPLYRGDRRSANQLLLKQQSP